LGKCVSDMRKILLLFFILINFSVFGQDFSVNPDPVTLSLGSDIVDKKVDMVITNNLASDTEFYWSIDSEGVPEEWEFYLCDLNLCYTPATQSCPCTRANLIKANESSTLMMHIIANGVEGIGAITLSILSECEGSNSIVDIPIAFEVGTTSTEFAEINNGINLYPNPVQDLINLKNDEEVSQIEIYNIVGKKIKSFDHLKGQSHDVSDFNKGIYLIRLLNKSNNILKVLRMTKK